MKVDSISNNMFFGNKKGGVKYLRIIRDDFGNIRFINTTKDKSNVAVFVAGGSEVDKRVRNANLKAIMHNRANQKSCAKPSKKGILNFLKNLLNL